MSWIKVEEHVPPEGKLFRVYSSVYGTYTFAKWSAARGWLSQDGDHLQVVTDWDDAEMDFPFPILDEIDTELAEKYGIPTRKTLFG